MSLSSSAKGLKLTTVAGKDPPKVFFLFPYLLFNGFKDLSIHLSAFISGFYCVMLQIAVEHKDDTGKSRRNNIPEWNNFQLAALGQRKRGGGAAVAPVPSGRAVWQHGEMHEVTVSGHTLTGTGFLLPCSVPLLSFSSAASAHATMKHFMCWHFVLKRSLTQHKMNRLSAKSLQCTAFLSWSLSLTQ